MLMCSYTLNPPYNAVYIDVRGSDGLLPRQVFEHAAVFHEIATPDNYIQFCEFRHPISRGFIDLCEALSRVIAVTPKVQAQINTERRLHGLTAVEGLNEDDRKKYAATMVRMEDQTIDPCEIGADDPGNQMEGRSGVNLSRPPPQERSVDGTLFILGDPPRNCSCIVVQILISVEVRLFQ